MSVRWAPPLVGWKGCLMMKVRAAVVSVVSASAVVFSAGLASAETAQVTDAPRDMGHHVDVQSVTVRHTAQDVVVRVRHEDLRRHGNAGLSVFFDTEADRKGPESVLGGGLFDGTDYLLTGASGWRSDNTMVECSYRMRVNFAKDVSVVRADRGCFDDAFEVRVAVRASGEAGSRKWRYDWAGDRRWGDWLVADPAAV